MHPHIEQLISCINLEEKEQAERYKLDEAHSLKVLKAEGIALHPLIIVRKTFGYADYPEISFRISFPPEVNMFKDGAAIECFRQGEVPVKGLLMSLDGKAGEFRLFAPDFPDWIEEDGVGIKLAPDTRTSSIMKKALMQVEADKRLLSLFERLHGQSEQSELKPAGQPRTLPIFFNKLLNLSQQQAVTAILDNEELCIVHGPPGTGKTTTLIEAIRQLVADGSKIMLSAPSNAAVDNICKGLITAGTPVLRVGNAGKVDAAVFPFTPEGRMANSKLQKDIRQLKLRADEFRRMALKYKRSFGKAEREQRQLLFKEVKSIRQEIKQLQQYNEEKLLGEAAVIAGTPIGLYDAGLEKIHFDHLIIDEAGQCLEPLAWCILPFASRITLAGDHLQLPPTVLSDAAARKGFNKSMLEVAVAKNEAVYLLDVQYRMRPAIAGFSAAYFYGGKLKTDARLAERPGLVEFIDTAGSGFNETRGPDGVSLQNEGELKIIGQLFADNQFPVQETSFISPYSGQVAMAKEKLPQGLRISTIDSFQGQEQQNIILSLVRSNDECEIGFLNDYRRMNVAITRAQEKLIVIGDSATLGADEFYQAFLAYVETNGSYRSVWEFDIS